MRCLHCGKRLSLLRKFSDGEFCSAEHRQIFQQQQSDLALARLLESQTRIAKPLTKAKPEPKPAPRPRVAAAIDDDRQVPEAPTLVEWGKPVARKQIAVPRLYSLDPTIASEVPQCLLRLQQNGFPEASGLASITVLAPRTHQARPAVLNPLFRLGIRLPASPEPVAPARTLPFGAVTALTAGDSLSGTFLALHADAEPAEWAAESHWPRYSAGTVAPERAEEPAPEPLQLVDRLLPLTMPAPGMSQGLPISIAPPPMATRRDPVHGLAPGHRTERVAEEESEPLPMAEALQALAAPAVERGPSLPMVDQAPQTEPWDGQWAESLPAYVGEAAVVTLRDATDLYPVAGPQVSTVHPLLCLPDAAALLAEAEPLAPGPHGAPRRPKMRQIRRTARLKLMAQAAVAGFAAAPVEALTVSPAPGTPSGPRVRGGEAPVFQNRLRPLHDGSAQDAPRPLVSTEQPVEMVDAAVAPFVPTGGFQTEIPVPVVMPEEAETVLTPVDIEQMVVRKVRPLLVAAEELASADGLEELARAVDAAMPVQELAPALVMEEAQVAEAPALAPMEVSAWEEPAVEPVALEETIAAGEAAPAGSLAETVGPVEAESLALEAAPVESFQEPLEPVEAASVESISEALPAVEEEFTPLPPLCRELRLFAGRGEAGAGPVVHVNEAEAGCWTDALAQDPMRPKSRLVIDHADGSGARRAPVDKPPRIASGLHFDLAKLPGRRFWAHAPSDLKWVALALPVILGLVVYSFKASPPKSEAGRPVVTNRVRSVIGGELNSIQKVILERAAIKLYDDFRGGLGSWQGIEGWAKTWKYGEASFLEPGQLALYSPTVNMRDYTMQFLGQIERRSLNWVFRATDSKNYYAMRIVITRGGPLPQASVVRYAVIDGKETGTKTLPLPFPVHSDTLYLVKMEVRGDSYVTYIQNQVVDNFSDSRLASGGVGFFSPKGDKSYLRWVEVTHQYDVLGRLCAFLAPYNVQAEGRKTE